MASKFDRLIESLLRQTEKGKIEWEQIHVIPKFVTPVMDDYILEVRREPDGSTHLAMHDLFNREAFDVSTNAGELSNPQRLAELYDVVEQQVTKREEEAALAERLKVDAQIDRLLKTLEETEARP